MGIICLGEDESLYRVSLKILATLSTSAQCKDPSEESTSTIKHCKCLKSVPLTLTF